MGRNNSEQERLRKLRQNQLADRDPLIKQRQFQRLSANRERGARKPVTFASIWRDIPGAWKGFFYGILLGTLLLIIVPTLWISPWAVPIGVLSILVFSIFGVIVGRALDARDNIKDLMK